MTLEEARALMAPSAIQHLKDMVSENIIIDTSKKCACDIIMAAFCKAIETDVIHKTSLNDQFVTMLNSSTNTMSQSKLGELLKTVQVKQPNIACVITLFTPDMSDVIEEWVYKTANPTFNRLYEFVIDYFKITPEMIRKDMSKVLKQTISNNVAQFTLKYNQTADHDSLVVSITTITRLVNMVGHIITCEFREV
jgi:hypothetical protein